MIADRTEYDFVSVDDSVVVDGGIMPLREGTGLSSRNALRGEDAAFAVEAADERATVCGIGRTGIVELGREILGETFASAIGVLHSSADMACNEGAGISTKEVTAAQFASDIADSYPGLAFDASSLESDASEFERGMPLVASGVMSVFSDISALVRFRRRGASARTSDLFSEIGGGDGWERVSIPATGRRLFCHYAVKEHESYSQRRVLWKEAKASAGAVGALADGADPYVRSAKVVIPVTVTEVLLGTTSEKHAFVVSDAWISGGAALADMSSVEADVESLVNSMYRLYTGQELPDPPDAATSSVQEVYVDMSANAFSVMDLGDHTRF